MAFGVYTAVSLAQARALRDEAKKKLAEGIDPSFAKKEEKLVRDVQLNNTYQAVALEWHGTKMSRWSESYASDIIELAARLQILTGVRTGKLRGAFWSEFDLEKVVWEIPAERMKMKRPHLVPLSPLALEIVQQFKVVSGQYPLVFQGGMIPAKR